MKLNPNLKLPNSDINVVVRGEPSGTTFHFTSYISKANIDWANNYGAKAALNLNIYENFYDMLVYTKGVKSYPITALTFVIVKEDDLESAKKVTIFFNWAFENQKAQNIAKSLGYLLLSDDYMKIVREYWEKYDIYPK